MSQTVSFDYFYGGESELFSYYRITKLLVTGEQFKELSKDAKLLYGLLLDRMNPSAKNGWYDDNGRVIPIIRWMKWKQTYAAVMERPLSSSQNWTALPSLA